MKLVTGWVQIAHMRKAHYFRAGVSLCKKWDMSITQGKAESLSLPPRGMTCAVCLKRWGGSTIDNV